MQGRKRPNIGEKSVNKNVFITEVKNKGEGSNS